jgi:hypothetical protein
MRQGADAELDEEALVAEDLVLEEDLLDHLLRAADKGRAAECPRRLELGPSGRRLAALAPDAGHRFGKRRERLVSRLL